MIPQLRGALQRLRLVTKVAPRYDAGTGNRVEVSLVSVQTELNCLETWQPGGYTGMDTVDLQQMTAVISGSWDETVQSWQIDERNLENWVSMAETWLQWSDKKRQGWAIPLFSVSWIPPSPTPRLDFKEVQLRDFGIGRDGDK
ncbi:hypothetical protein NM208_g15401 [Fusarium decemcellulare]|uniref:Uncharacterized protein n=1 Tax=Fusarium decemcellulare TaxID=57161 RepID=A0ACC1REC6_9HYPO|nr:hypothetical protein NM208_g15401 [Fusarium decemcellulare]